MKLKDVVNSILSNKETKVSDEEIIDTIKLLASEAYYSKHSNLEVLFKALEAIADKHGYAYVSTLSQRKG